ncbi:hypothetical protein SGGMMB4_03698 [Sodalis glossinidius str. 'morsitans']|uniref:Uncharacterized protein n=1 Tax=Sodalis glossinidius (strain morsitans) TaxID=343509 RepID=A0A193QKT1_SODGM|nr:hypothetical protein SGGMMB4_03698 [Sodalis glossinidius str. 'morsitans']
MSFVIGNKFFSNTLSTDRIREYAANKHKSPLVMTLWERVKDFFFGGETKNCIRLLNDTCHPPIASTIL